MHPIAAVWIPTVRGVLAKKASSMAPESLSDADILRLTVFLPSVILITALVEHPAGAVLACACTLVTLISLSGVQVPAAQGVVSVPGRKTLYSTRGEELIFSLLSVIEAND